ncbi:MAG: hypothetical protein Q8922_05825 [Bacteroidota bacterium]|nr:hypothetical protein [Bacteroidota bacterium]MDP4234068.1 hypothetical protein [Bacteroidota bacterium]MDP4243009.1 hypothetical protein [Bacteroidota bacterium]MDP4287435.1 hypothetical protein [Bacteroidota bacterium]
MPRILTGILLLFLAMSIPAVGLSFDAQPKPKHGKTVRHARHHKPKKAKRHSATSAHKGQSVKPEVKRNMPPPGHEGQEHSDWFFQRRAWPKESIDPDVYPNALAQAAKMPVYRAAGKYSSLSAQTWQSIGPYSIDGRATCIATHPTDSNTFYVGAASGGLWKTVNHGATWRCVNDTFGSLPTGCVAIDPTQPETLYLGMGETNGSADSYPGNGLWKTTNGGDSWTYLGFAKAQYIAKIIIDGHDHNNLFIAIPGPGNMSDTNRGVFRSTDGGATWTRSLFVRAGASKSSTPVTFIDVAMNPLNSAQVVAFAWDHTTPYGAAYSSGPAGPYSGVYRSDDTGTTWMRCDTLPNSGLPNAAKWRVFSRGALLWTVETSELTRRSWLFAAYIRSDTNAVTRIMSDDNFQGLYRSSDAGMTWTKILDSTIRIPMGGVQGKDSANITNAQGGYDLFLTAGPSPLMGAPDLYFGGIDVFRSTNLGDSWKDITNSYSEYYAKGDRRQHSDQHALAFTCASGGNDMLVASDGGVFHTDDHGATWEQIKGLPITQFYAVTPWRGGMANMPTPLTAADLKVYGGTQDNGTVGHGLTSDSAFEWINGGDGTECVSHPTDSNKIISSLQFGVIFGRNTLDSLTHVLPTTAKDTTHDTRPRWHSLTNRLLKGPNALTDTAEAAAWAVPIALDDQQTTDLYTGRCHVYKATIDWNDLENVKWQTWSKPIAGNTGNVRIWGYGDIESMAIGPRDAAGHPMLWAGAYGAIWRTLVDPTRNDTTPPVWARKGNVFSGGAISAIVPDRSDSLTAIVTSANAGFPQHVLRTTNGGTTWTNISGNLPNAPVSALVIDTLAEHGDPNKKNMTLIVGTDVGVYVTTDGGGSWSALGTGMPHIIVSDLKIYKNMLIAATHGRSLYAIDISDIQSASRGVAEGNAHSMPELAIYPNPAAGAFVVSLGGTDGRPCQCLLMNAATGLAHSVEATALDNGTYRIVPEQSLPSGAYFVELISGGRVLGRGRVSILK